MASATLSKSRQDSTPLQRLRAVDASTWAKVAFAGLCVVALFGYFAFPTYPTYDSFYALLWGRDLLHLHLPDFRVYRGPTEHPLAIAFGMLCSLFGQGGARLMVLGSIASFVALVAGVYRLARLCFGPVVGMFAGLLMLSRFFDENLAAQGYLDISYIALIVWAVALEVEKPRRGTLVFAMLAAAGLLRPDAWVLSGVYWLWCVWPPSGDRGDPERRARAETSNRPARGSRRPSIGRHEQSNAHQQSDAPLVPRPGGDRAAGVGRRRRGGHRQPAVLAALDRRAGPGTGAHAGVVQRGRLGVDVFGADRQAAGRARRPDRRADRPLARPAPRGGSARGARPAGARIRGRGRRRRVGDRPLPDGRRGGADRLLRGGDRGLVDARAGIEAAPRMDGWSRGAGALRNGGCRHHAEPLQPAHDAGLPRGLPQGARGCPREPEGEGRAEALSAGLAAEQQADPRRALDPRQRRAARHRRAQPGARRRGKGSHALEDRIRRGSVAVYPLGSAVFFEAIVDVGDDPRDQVPLAGFRRIYTSRYYAVYANC